MVSDCSIHLTVDLFTYTRRENDGAGEWSSFAVSVGTPSQTSRVLVSTAGYETWVVLNDGCPTKYGSSCANERGGIFNTNNSSSWTNIELYTLSGETNLGYSGNGQFGYDTVIWGYLHSAGPELSKQIVAGFATPDYWLGQIGLDPKPSNFTTLNEPQPSYLWTLRNQSKIPSTSWGYTAGAAYRYDKVQGSLTLGGYDTSRFSTNNLTFPFYNDNSRRFLVSLRSVSYKPTGVSTITTSTTLSSDAISIYIDSTIPYIYLPLAACAKFESEFGLTWDAINEIYTLNETAHNTLKSSKPDLTFTIANNNGQTLDFIIPYGAFDLTASFPVLANGSTPMMYFPLKRAANDTQFTLGRVFLQEAYLTADYDRSEFVVAPCVWPSTFQQNLVAIYPPDSNQTISAIPGPEDSKSTPIGAIIGGVLGGLILLAAALAYWYFVVRRKRRQSEVASAPGPVDVNDSNGLSAYEKMNHLRLSEVAGSTILDHDGELDDEQGLKNNQRISEIAGRPLLGQEMDGQGILVSFSGFVYTCLTHNRVIVYYQTQYQGVGQTFPASGFYDCMIFTARSIRLGLGVSISFSDKNTDCDGLAYKTPRESLAGR
ncbi:hypothetical protein VTL71DRAFT_8619 [Oculimacula yallundae]|uniref:Peptidase A1 domain-containing protein n=1 Tax=Oculimacula yallundae TaxID=86028 RepID=A0ABR4CY81_9HELO